VWPLGSRPCLVACSLSLAGLLFGGTIAHALVSSIPCSLQQGHDVSARRRGPPTLAETPHVLTGAVGHVSLSRPVAFAPVAFCPYSLHQIEVSLLCAASSEGRGGGGGGEGANAHSDTLPGTFSPLRLSSRLVSRISSSPSTTGRKSWSLCSRRPRSSTASRSPSPSRASPSARVRLTS
jgi:hypothetical protein